MRRREEARTRELADTQERLERADKEAREKEERMKKELKGKEWIWGPNGEVRLLSHDASDQTCETPGNHIDVEK